jgi:predicted AlkP superfamily pyrophosphatase or phosphodiesterase
MQFFSYARLAAIASVVLLAHSIKPAFAADGPALVVVVSVDQLAYDYLERFRKNYADDGVFALCQRGGVWMANCHHRHAFTITAPGHAVQLTGCYPSEHGIIENEWFDREQGKKVYCVADPAVKLIGTTIADTPVSPRNLWADTLGDRMKIVDRRSKVFGIAIKDRASILMTGHLADAAYWMSNDGLWITSDYYRKDLPGYLRTINESDALERYAGQTWDRLLPANHYLHGEVEDSFGEKPYAGASADFPHVILNDIKQANFVKQVAGSPFGNALVLQAAAAVLEYEKLGDDDAPDMLCINLSSNDYVGHSFGPHSLEVEDMTYRTDKLLGEFVKSINDRLAGKHWVFALTADHAVCPVPEIMQKLGLPAGRDPFGKANDKGHYEALSASLDNVLRQALKVPDSQKQPLIQFSTEKEIFLQTDHPALQGDRLPQAQRLVRDYLLQQPAVAAAATRYQLLYGQGNTKLDLMFRRAFHPKRSGDVLYAMRPYYIYGQTAGTTHGSPWQYDTHVPLLLLSQGGPGSGGTSLKPGTYHSNVSPAQLAPTLARLLNIMPPAMCVEEGIEEILK